MKHWYVRAVICLGLLLAACGNGESPLARIEHLESANVQLESGTRTYDAQSDSSSGLGWGRSDAFISQRFVPVEGGTVNDVKFELRDAVLADGWIQDDRSSQMDPASEECCSFVSEVREIDGYWFQVSISDSHRGSDTIRFSIKQQSVPTTSNQ